jgi:cilia- and flagella-associated protein 53
MEKAYALRDQREAERRKFVEEAYERVWKDSCDDLRDLDGRALDKFMGLEREKQVQEKQERKALEEANANAYYAEWSKRLDAIANADKAKQEVRAEANARTARGLQEQMEERKKQYEDRYNRMMQEAAEESAECNAAIQEDRDKQNRLRQEAVERGRQVQEFNRKYKDLADQKAAIEAHQDAVLLQNALKLEKEQIEFEQAKQREGAEAAKQYRKYLEQMMVKEAEDTGFQDEMNRREFEKVQKARDDTLQARQDARDYLMKLVHEGREEQIAYKKAQEIKEREEGKAFANKFLENMKSGIAKDKQVAEERRARNINNRQKLQEQMMEQEAAKLAARQEVFLEDKKMRFIENKHREKLARQGGVVRLNFAKQRPDTR